MEREKLVDFLDRTFAERLQEDTTIDRATLYPEWIEENVDNLLVLEEFRFTKKINVLKLPAYLAPEGDKTLTPIEIESPEQKTKSVMVMSYIINNQMETHYFPEIVNLYVIASFPKVYDNSQVEEIIKQNNKVHVLPPVVDVINFNTKHEIRFSWNPGEPLLDSTPEEWRKEVLKQVESALDNYETTFPYTKNYMIRGTHLNRESLITRD